MAAPQVRDCLRMQARTDTPLRAVWVCQNGASQRLWLKLEQHNPTGSIKYRTAVGLLAALDAERPLVPGTVVVESTSGNLGLALARVLAHLDCRLIAVIDAKATAEMREVLVAEGAELVLVQDRDEHGGYLLNRLAKVRELCRENPELRWPDQYHNPANPRIHRDTIAMELFEQTGGRLDALFVAVSTGGTVVGVSEGLRTRVPGLRVFAVDVHGSLVTSDVGQPHLLTGVGATRKSSFLCRDQYDRAVQVFDVEAFAYCRMLERDTGLGVGGSGGAVLAAACEHLREGSLGVRCPVAVIADGATNYRQTLYDDGWLACREVLDRMRAAEARARARGLEFVLEIPHDAEETTDGGA